MAHRETRRRDTVLTSIETSSQTVGKGIRRLTIGVGRGIKDFTTGTVDAIIHPQTIPSKLENCVDRALVQPTLRTVSFVGDSTLRTANYVEEATLRTVGFVEDSAHRALTETDRAFHERVKKAQKGARNLKVVFAHPLLNINAWSFAAECKKYPKSDADAALIDAAIGENLFAGLEPSGRAALVGAFEPHLFRMGEKIIAEGDAGDYFYVLRVGIVEFFVRGKAAGTAGKGSSFGELALLYNATRVATVVAKTHCALFRLDQDTFRRILAHQIQESRAEVLAILKKVSCFKNLDETYLNKIANNLKRITYQDGDVVASREEDTAKMFVIVKEGAVDVTGLEVGGSESKDISMTAGSFFGEYAVLKNKWDFVMAKARGETVALTLDREQFILAVGSDIDTLLRKTRDKKMLALIPYGKGERPAGSELDFLAGAIKEKKFPPGHVFFAEGRRHLPALYLLREGKVSIQSSSHTNVEAHSGCSLESEETKTIEKDGYFGNDTFGDNERGEIGLARYTVVALEEVEAGVLYWEAAQPSFRIKHAAEEEKLGMGGLDMIRMLGTGTFGKVWLVTRKGTDNAYALKVQVKQQLIEYGQVDAVIREKSIMTELDHPFIIKMAGHWKDEDKLYMLLKLYPGGELMTVIHTARRDGVPEFAAKFYAANILEGLSFMHRRHVVYRDLKPENVLLDGDGYTVIADLGFAKIVKDKTYTFCGTPLYLAPEIIMQRGYDKGADHWSWGVLLYEMIVGMTPFYTGVEDQMDLFKNIVECKMQQFPPGNFMSDDSKNLIRRMLKVRPNHRLGSLAGADRDIKKHPFFKDIDWDKLAKKEMEAPFKPDVSNPLDGSNFDDYSKLEADTKREKYKKLSKAEQKLFSAF